MILHKPFITDSGAPPPERGNHGREESILPRFTVWKWDPVKQLPEVVEVGDDFEELRAKYDIPANRVVVIKRPRP